MAIAVIGLGTMGAPMAVNLMKAGHEVIVHNRTRSREEEVVARGARSAASPREAAAAAEVALVCVADTPDVQSVVLDESEGVIAGMQPGGLVIDGSTIAPEATREMAAALAAREIGCVDAPVSGGSEGAIAGTLAIMCGGSEADFARALPYLEAIGKAITHVGPSGSGQIAKAVNQVVISGVYQAVAEGIALAARAGADPRRVIEAISGGAASSWVLANRAPNMLDDRYPLGFRMRLHRKDLGIALATARATGAHLPVASYVATTEDSLIGMGYGEEDMSALARAVRRASSLADGPV